MASIVCAHSKAARTIDLNIRTPNCNFEFNKPRPKNGFQTQDPVFRAEDGLREERNLRYAMRCTGTDLAGTEPIGGQLNPGSGFLELLTGGA
jgi:hypothetical protein